MPELTNYPSTSSAQAGGRRKRRSASPKRRSASPKRRSASPKRRSASPKRRRAISPSRKAKKMMGGAKKATAVRKGSYESMTVEKLVKKARKYGVAYSGLTKSKLIRAIRAKKGALKKAKKH